MTESWRAANLERSRKQTTSEPSWLNRAQSTKLGALFISWDFGLGIVAGAAAGALFAFSPAVRIEAFTFFLALGGIAAGVAALVLAPMGMMLSALSPGFQQLLLQVRDGLPGLLLPFRRVASIAASASLLCLGVSLVSLIETPPLPWTLYALATGLPIGLFVWSIAGCVQVIALSISTIEQDRRFQNLHERKKKAKKAS